LARNAAIFATPDNRYGDPPAWLDGMTTPYRTGGGGTRAGPRHT
jgi:hypothetical protein